MIETTIVDDLFTEEEQKLIHDSVLHGPWLFVNDMSYNNSEYPSYGFIQLFKHPNYEVKSTLYENICVLIINKLIDRYKLKIKDIYHSRAFLQIPLEKKFVKDNNGIHIDLPIDHIACVYYCNDTDGDTILYEQTKNNTVMGSNNVNVIEHKRVTPKKGRLVFFDGSRYHCSTQPTEKYRLIINFNLV